MAETVTLPKRLLEDLIKHLDGVSSVLSTLEELLDEEGLKRIREGLKDYEEKNYVTAKNIEELRRTLFES
ncbi:MAG: hypothetical protein QXS66_07150 [Thermoproteota archaeon]|nr:hypothetical protein [Candidatus Brockarchaeota archaeon]